MAYFFIIIQNNSPYCPPRKKTLAVSAFSGQFDFKNAKHLGFSVLSKLTHDAAFQRSFVSDKKDR